MLLCTDLHPDNVLAARREPWLVIDPKRYLGDPTYDPLQHVLNHSERLRADPVGFAARMADLLDLDAGRLRLWLFARCVQESLDDPGLQPVANDLARVLRLRRLRLPEILAARRLKARSRWRDSQSAREHFPESLRLGHPQGVAGDIQ